MIEVVDQLDAYDPVASDIMSTQLRNILSMVNATSKTLDEYYLEALDNYIRA